MNQGKIHSEISNGEISIGIELGSTRIKTVAIDTNFETIGSGYFEWENEFKDGYWTYSINDVWIGLQKSYKSMTDDIESKYNVTIKKVKSIGISGMMHGYLAFDKNDDLLVPFRTWRNSYTEEAANKLRDYFQFNIPERWSIAHLYQAILNEEQHVKDIQFITTLAGYIHWYLTEQKVLGVGDASGMFPIDQNTKKYDQEKLNQFDELIKDKQFEWDIESVLPKVLTAGTNAGYLTEQGAKLLDPTNNLEPGVPLCPPEGDAGTGMVATNSVEKKKGNISAGTSAFAMLVLDQPLSKVHPEIDIVTTPSGDLVAMVHTNNCTSDINAWVNLFEETFEVMGVEVDKNQLYERLFNHTQHADERNGNLLSYGYISGENITKINKGIPIFLRPTDSQFNLANFMKTHIMSAFSTLKIGVDILKEEEEVLIDSFVVHGGIFKTEEIAQRILGAALNSSVEVLKTANDGGAWGMAILARYMVNNDSQLPLNQYLEENIFGQQEGSVIQPSEKDVEEYEQFITEYKKGLEIERKASQFIR
ncbi:FGGY-family carbohydrate kinase [Staphylococcus lentus]|uniref:xylulokinase n=1 Tax=Mammaliicoccus lentus TaxID=42858 RepID=UPI0018838274|nr:FGGY-family carbohydrate kinase [Mammaliicoccus lentus]MBF0840384.1 FGGY-family carbohydrate kinase [Mammaliicoccus lentus]